MGCGIEAAWRGPRVVGGYAYRSLGARLESVNGGSEGDPRRACVGACGTLTVADVFDTGLTRATFDFPVMAEDGDAELPQSVHLGFGEPVMLSDAVEWHAKDALWRFRVLDDEGVAKRDEARRRVSAKRAEELI